MQAGNIETVSAEMQGQCLPFAAFLKATSYGNSVTGRIVQRPPKATDIGGVTAK